jgi:hypothetical protein
VTRRVRHGYVGSKDSQQCAVYESAISAGPGRRREEAVRRGATSWWTESGGVNYGEWMYGLVHVQLLGLCTWATHVATVYSATHSHSLLTPVNTHTTQRTQCHTVTLTFSHRHALRSTHTHTLVECYISVAFVYFIPETFQLSRFIVPILPTNPTLQHNPTLTLRILLPICTSGATAWYVRLETSRK